MTTDPVSRFGRPDLVAADLDGTLLPPNCEIPPDLPDALRDLRTAGIPFVISTGRMLRSVRAVAARMGVREDLVICYQGAMVADLATGEWLYHRPVECATAVAVVQQARALGRQLNAFIDDRLYVEQLGEWAQRYAEYAAVDITLVPDLTAEVEARPPTKFVMLTDAADVDTLLPALQRHWRGRLNVVRSLATNIELVDAGADKSHALQWLCDRRGLGARRSVACGDGQNDIGMLAWAGLGVAVAEAAPAVRDAARLVLPRAALPGLFRRFAGDGAGAAGGGVAGA